MNTKIIGNRSWIQQPYGIEAWMDARRHFTSFYEAARQKYLSSDDIEKYRRELLELTATMPSGIEHGPLERDNPVFLSTFKYSKQIANKRYVLSLRVGVEVQRAINEVLKAGFVKTIGAWSVIFDGELIQKRAFRLTLEILAQELGGLSVSNIANSKDGGTVKVMISGAHFLVVALTRLLQYPHIVAHSRGALNPKDGNYYGRYVYIAQPGSEIQEVVDMQPGLLFINQAAEASIRGPLF